MSDLTNLSINNCQLSDIQGIANCSNLSSLDLSNTQVADIQILQHLIGLNNLDLSNTNVVDFRPLEKLGNLYSLNLRGTDISPSSLHALRTALRNCAIAQLTQTNCRSIFKIEAGSIFLTDLLNSNNNLRAISNRTGTVFAILLETKSSHSRPASQSKYRRDSVPSPRAPFR